MGGINHDLLVALKALVAVCEKQPRISKLLPEDGSPLGLAQAAIKKAEAILDRDAKNWLRNTTIDIMVASEVEEAELILGAAIQSAPAQILDKAASDIAAPEILEALKVTARGLEGEFGPRAAEANFPALYAAIARSEASA